MTPRPRPPGQRQMPAAWWARRACRGWVLALLAWALLAPGISRGLALAQAAGQPWVVCSASDTAASPADNGNPAKPTHHALDHCPLCLWQADALALPAALASAAPWAVVGHLPLPVLTPQRRPRRAWGRARPRGPPPPY